MAKARFPFFTSLAQLDIDESNRHICFYTIFNSFELFRSKPLYNYIKRFEDSEKTAENEKTNFWNVDLPEYKNSTYFLCSRNFDSPVSVLLI